METNEASGAETSSPIQFPGPLRSALAGPPLPRRGWQTSIAPSYIALFLWVVYFDRLGCRTLSIGGLGWSLLGAAAAGFLCYVLLYHVPATWGQRTGWPSTVLGASTFGAVGTVWLMFVVFGLAQILWLAVATFYSVDWTFQGLSSVGLFSPKHLKMHAFRVGQGASRFVEVRSTIFLVTSLFWLFAAAIVGNYLVRVIQALMNVYPIFPALMLGLAMVLTIGGVPGFRPLEVDPATAQPIQNGGPRAFTTMIQLIFGFFAVAGVAAADWGAVARSPRDVRLGGWVGVVFASWTVAALALLTVAGALGRYPVPPPMPNASIAESFTFRVALLLGVPEGLAGAMFLVFGLASLAPTCYAAFLFGQRFSAIAPEVARIKWTLLGATASWPLIATGLAGRLEEIVTILGALFAPMLGAMAGDYSRSRGVWPGVRRGLNPAGLAAWACGVVVGLVPLAVTTLRAGDGSRFQPAAVYAFLTAFLVYQVLARLGFESPVLAIPQPLPIPELSQTSEPVPTLELEGENAGP